MATGCGAIVYVANTNVIELSGLKSLVEDAFVNDAIVTFTIIDGNGDAVDVDDSGFGGWPLTMEPKDGTDEAGGNYIGIIPDALELVAGDDYTALIDANAGVDRVGHWEFVFKAKTRHGT